MSPFFFLRCQAVFLRPSSANGAGACIVLEHGIRTCACTGEGSVFLDQKLNRYSGQTQSHQTDGQEYNFPFHVQI